MERSGVIVKSCRSPGELALLSRARDAPSPATREKSDACVGGIRVLEPESVLFLEIFSLLPMLPVFMLYR